MTTLGQVFPTRDSWTTRESVCVCWSSVGRLGQGHSLQTLQTCPCFWVKARLDKSVEQTGAEGSTETSLPSTSVDSQNDARARARGPLRRALQLAPSRRHASLAGMRVLATTVRKGALQ